MVLLRISRSALSRPSTFRPATFSHTRAFTNSSSRYLKEDQKDPSPEEAERVKQEQLKKQERGEGHWHEELASKGESNVKADREKVEDHDDHIEDLQQETKEQADKGKI